MSSFHDVVTPLVEHDLLDGMKRELPAYLAACAGFTVDHDDVKAFSDKVFKWWQNHHSEFPTWAKAARMVFSFTPSSAASERVFSLLKQLFGDQQLSSLMDYIQGSIMLNYNDRAL